MPRTKLNIIKPVVGVSDMSDGDLLARLNAVYDNMLNNPAFPTPPIDFAAFKTAIDAYTAAVAAALDGGKTPTAERDKRRSDAAAMLRTLGHYVETAAKGDPKTFLSSGFASSGPRTPTGPVSVPAILKLDQGAPGELVVSLVAVAGARSYEVRYAPSAAPGTAINWTSITVPSTRPPASVDNLTPGVIYAFQARAFGKLGFSEWSASATRMCI